MPMYLLNLYSKELPRIIAERNLQQIDVLAVGGGMMKEDAAKHIVGEWHRVATLDSDTKPVIPTSSDPKPSPDELGVMLEASGWRKTSGPSRVR